MDQEFLLAKSLGWNPPQPQSDGVYYFGQEDPSVSYPIPGLDVLGLDGGHGYWFDHRAKAVAQVLNKLEVRSLWEVGAGTGAMALRLSHSLQSIVTVEPLPDGARASATLGLPALCGTLQELQLPTASLPAIGLFDVVEHLESPSDLLMEVRRVLDEDGKVIVTVPAFQYLWGDEDNVAGHWRRYRKSSLRRQFESLGFSELHSEYLFGVLVPLAAGFRALPYRLGRRQSPERVLAKVSSQLAVNPSVDRMARGVLTAESKLAKFMPLPVGLSILAAYAAPGR